MTDAPQAASSAVIESLKSRALSRIEGLDKESPRTSRGKDINFGFKWALEAFVSGEIDPTVIDQDGFPRCINNPGVVYGGARAGVVWLREAKNAKRCKRCDGRGNVNGLIHNNVFGGICFKCEGRGFI